MGCLKMCSSVSVSHGFSTVLCLLCFADHMFPFSCIVFLSDLGSRYFSCHFFSFLFWRRLILRFSFPNTVKGWQVCGSGLLRGCWAGCSCWEGALSGMIVLPATPSNDHRVHGI